uniref:Cell division protein ZapA n=1 Tax=Candidatus Kentrum sp. MB TaxID=2138164 RepID=A0A450WYX0_9GAMM|nr:MAG: cell division protein ZapA [Candidatus Kentron sp. MB]VFK32624.1 MAG: cell division protein ZapA [Candidatus Kentron sp. MB]VFK76003.1 MAG: cell division protein ZapA [Candidatus Kentron sp. MB]
MNKNTTPINIQILDKEYVVSCPAEERQDLIASARILDEKMRHTRDVARVYGTERIAVISALNVVHEFLQMSRNQENKDTLLAQMTDQLVGKLDAALAQEKDHHPLKADD